MTKTIYTCPMHPEIIQDQPGKCPKCGGMELQARQVPVDTPSVAKVTVSPFLTYGSLLIVIFLIVITASLAGLGGLIDHTFAWLDWSRYIMAGFFLSFSLLKFIDIHGFAEGFATYDLLAKKFRPYGLIYPYLELSLGLSYLLNFQPLLTNLATIIIMGLASIGVATALSSQRQLQCACLGTVLKVPLSKVTLIEDLVMVAMAAIHVGFILLVPSMGMDHHQSAQNPTDGFILSLMLLSSLAGIMYIQYLTKDSHS